MTKEDIKGIVNGTLSKVKVEKATEVKVAIMTFQDVPPGFSPSRIIAAHPQSNNECSEFTRDMEAAANQVATSFGAAFLNFGVDGVSLETFDVCQAICDFLSGKCKHLGATDTNHDIKSWRYQIIGGSLFLMVTCCVKLA